MASAVRHSMMNFHPALSCARQCAAVAGKRRQVKLRKTVTIDPELYEWVENRMGPTKQFASFSHAVQVGLGRLRDSM